eukprot:4926675-Pleurochrysis_carterae.AAC.2
MVSRASRLCRSAAAGRRRPLGGERGVSGSSAARRERAVDEPEAVSIGPARRGAEQQHRTPNLRPPDLLTS